MKLFFSLFFLFFYFLPFQSQAQVLMNRQVYQNMDQFNWLDFTHEENIQKHINFRNQRFNSYGAEINTITGLNIAKLQLLRIEQELGLYKTGIKTGLSSEVMTVEEAIRSHWDNIINIEQQIQAQAGFVIVAPESVIEAPLLDESVAGIYPLGLRFGPAVNQPNWGVTSELELDQLNPGVTSELELNQLNSGVTSEPAVRLRPWTVAYRSGVKELYKGDHKVLFNIVEKKDRNLYNSLGQNDELFAQFALPQVERYVQKIEKIAGTFHSALSSLDQNSASELYRDVVNTLFFMHRDSLEIYNFFLKNFPNLVGENQQKLKRVIEGWYGNQNKWGAEALMTAYQYGIEDNPSAVTRSLHNFQAVPSDTRAEMGEFYRNEFLNNPAFINTNDLYKQGARTNALIGLKYLGLLEGSEVELFNRAVEEGMIKSLGENSFSASLKPLPTP